MNAASQNAVGLESIITTAELYQRPSRLPNYEAEHRALIALAHEMAGSPDNILQKLAQTALELCNAQSAGISLLKPDGSAFYWPAIAGIWATHIGGGTPRDFGPCGTVLDRNAPQLMSHVERHFTYLAPVKPSAQEALLIPFHDQGKAVGTVWVVAHEPGRRFDLEDLRVLTSLGAFASAAFKVLSNRQVVIDKERHFRETIDALPVAVYTTDAEGKLTHFNPACVEFSGRTPLLGSDHWCVSFKLFRLDGAPLPHDQCPMAISLKEGRAVRGEEAIAQRPDGSRVHFMAFPTPLFDSDGRVAGGVNMLLDITERKRAEGTRATLAAIVESSDDAIISKDLNGMITSWNRGAQHLFGYTAAEAIGQPVTMLIPLALRNEEPGILRRIRQGERIEHYETTRQRKDGTLVDISLSVSPIPDSQGRIVGASKIARDITERKNADKIVRESRDAAESANSAKDRFLAMLSHELRTPLTPVVMCLAAMDADKSLPAHIREDLEMIRRNIELESRLIDDMLDLSRITNGKMRLQLQATGLHQVIQHVVKNCSAESSSKKLNISLELSALNDQITADPARMQQVFWNLLRNAIKFTPRGGHIHIRSETSADGKVRVEVRDDGVGIPPEALSKIFNAFEQGDMKTTGNFGGLGLGLAICKAIIEMHAGTLNAYSQGTGTGAAFKLEMPALTAANIPGPSASPVSSKDASDSHFRVLLVEDHPDTARVLARLLTSSGYVVKTAGTIAAALHLASTESFDILISDLGLPDGTGYDLMGKIRRQCGTELKGIALSGNGMEEDIRRSREVGFSDHLTKPVNLPQLEALIQRIIADGHQFSENPAPLLLPVK